MALFPVDGLANDVFSDEHTLDVDGDYQSHSIRPHKFLYSGHVIDDQDSRVYGSMLDGIFDGHIYLGNGESYTIEKAARHFDVDQRPLNYHSILYNDEQINHAKFRLPKRKKRDADFFDDSATKTGAIEDSNDADRGCGLTKEVRDQMQCIQNSVEPQSYAQSTFYNESLQTRSHLSSSEHPDYAYVSMFVSTLQL